MTFKNSSPLVISLISLVIFDSMFFNVVETMLLECPEEESKCKTGQDVTRKK